MFDNYFCRVCEVKDNLKVLFSKENQILIDMLQSIANISITEADNFSHFICTNCIQDLKDTVAFKRQYENTRQKLVNQQRTQQLDHSKSSLEYSKPFHISNDCGEIREQPLKGRFEQTGNHPAEGIYVNNEFLDNKNHSASDKYLARISINCEIQSNNSSTKEVSIEKVTKAESEDEESESISSLDWIESATKSEYSCRICGQTFSQQVAYDHHRAKHKMQRPFHCDQCDKTFNVHAQLRVHKMLHRNPNSFQCKQCGKSYIEPRKLRAHQLLHTKPDLFKCKLCGKSFVNRSLLNEHISVHSDPDRFKCEDCGRNFYRSTHLKRHKLLHTTDKGFKCGECHKWFQRQEEFNLHLKLHTNPNLFKCEQCGKLFKRKATLKEHLMTHRNPNVFKCEKCDKVYSSSSTLRTHRKQHSTDSSIHCKAN